MAKLKGVKRINRILNDFIHQYVDEEVEVSMGTDFAYYYTKSKVTYTLLVSDVNEKWFRHFFLMNGYGYDDDIFLLSIFHELGHHCDGPEVSEEDERFSLVMKNWIERQSETTEEISMLYFSLPDEIAATRWAIDFLNTHRKEIAALWDELLPAIHRFYRKNNITND